MTTVPSPDGRYHYAAGYYATGTWNGDRRIGIILASLTHPILVGTEDSNVDIETLTAMAAETVAKNGIYRTVITSLSLLAAPADQPNRQDADDIAAAFAHELAATRSTRIKAHRDILSTRRSARWTKRHWRSRAIRNAQLKR